MLDVKDLRGKIFWFIGAPIIAIIIGGLIISGDSDELIVVETTTTIETFEYEPLKEIDLPQYSSIFRSFAYQKDTFMDNGVPSLKTQHFELKPDIQNFYDEIAIWNEPQNTIVIIPIFTISAYQESGFYAYFDGLCDESCLTTNIFFSDQISFSGSQNAIKILKLLGYEIITDIELDQFPYKLLDYEKVILLHNEYVTQKMFNAITSHPNVLYLYPNALYAEIEVDYEKNSITLIRGHNYPTEDIKNGFDWKFDNTHTFEYDTTCDNWEFYEIDNGVMLNCYPELIIHSDKKLLKFIKEF